MTGEQVVEAVVFLRDEQGDALALAGEAEANRIGQGARHVGDRRVDHGPAGHRLRIVGHVLRAADDSEGNAVRRQRLAPVLIGLGGEGVAEDAGKFAGAGATLVVATLLAVKLW